MAKITIIGGGIAGCTTAIGLGKQGHEVVILERDLDILQGTSARTPGRMGLGYHYFDSDTAKFYMTNTIEFMKKYSDCFLGDESTPYLRDGRYFIMKDSLIGLQELMASYDMISYHFEQMCRSDSSNDIFHDYHLHRSMKPEEFENDVNIDKVAFAIETKERLLDWNKYEARLKGEISELKIPIKTGFEVSAAVRTEDGKFQLLSKDKESETADYVINCSWQNIDKINETAGIGDAKTKKDDPDKSVTSRLKLLAEVELPESLREKHSMFFCVGLYAMFSNLGNGIGRITYAPVTNFGVTTDSQMPEQFERWLNRGLAPEEELEYGQKIIEGVAEYIPAMKDAKLLCVIPGIVKSKGAVKLDDRESPFHKRNYDGVEEQQIGWIDNAAMKLFYALANARKVSELIISQERSIELIREISSEVVREGFVRSEVVDRNRFFEISAPVLTNFFENHLERNFKSNDILSNPELLHKDLSNVHKNKIAVNSNITPNPILHLRSHTAIVPKSTLVR